VEAYYSDGDATSVSQFCFAGSDGCGIQKVPWEELTINDTCTSPLAPDGSFCSFKEFTPVCFGGMNLQTAQVFVDGVPGTQQPEGIWRASGGNIERVERSHALLQHARSRYSESAAKAFAAMAKLSYCGPLPGIPAAAASSCDTMADDRGMPSPCKHAGFTIIPGSVRTVAATDLQVWGSIFGFLARLNFIQKKSSEAGVLISIRGSIGNYANSVRDKQIKLVDGLQNCEGCGVHQGYYESFRAIEPSVKTHLQAFWCTPHNCRIFITGHGSGAAVASLLAWNLAQANYTIGTSYLFESPQIGNAIFAREMGDRFMGHERHGPIYSITHGKDSVPRWPFDEAYESWGVEAYYSDGDATRVSQFCFAGSHGCGIQKVAKKELTTNDTCTSPLAPDGSFCTFKAFLPQCYGGAGFQSLHLLPNTTSGALQPSTEAAATWHPSEEDGEQTRAIANDKKAEDFYSLAALEAFAALTKLSYCGTARGLGDAVQSTCNERRGPCSRAGFGIVPSTIVPMGVSYQPELTANTSFVNDTLFFYTALVRRTTAKFADAPFFMPSESCVLIFRGPSNQQNVHMSAEQGQVSLEDEACDNCTASAGILNAWESTLESKVLEALRRSGCEPKPHREAVNKVFVAGHALGGTIAALATYFLHRMGFNVQVSWLIEAGRPGNRAFVEFLSSKMVANQRPVPFWQVLHSDSKEIEEPRPVLVEEDSRSHGFGQHRFQVRFSNGDTSRQTLCTSQVGCGTSGPALRLASAQSLQSETDMPPPLRSTKALHPGAVGPQPPVQLPANPGSPTPLVAQPVIGHLAVLGGAGEASTQVPSAKSPMPPQQQQQLPGARAPPPLPQLLGAKPSPLQNLPHMPGATAPPLPPPPLTLSTNAPPTAAPVTQPAPMPLQPQPLWPNPGILKAPQSPLPTPKPAPFVQKRIVFPQETLAGSLLGEKNCALPFAPAGQMCMLVGYPVDSPYHMLPQCNLGGSIVP